jgi:alanine-synthesizing transaminase
VKSEFNRIERLPPYIFGEINKLKAKLRKEGKDIIDFGMGNPDMPTPKHIRDKLKEVTDKTWNRKIFYEQGDTWPSQSSSKIL